MLARPEKLVLAHGTFDLLHLGHIKHLKEAAAQGDRLVVGLTADQFVRKGNGRPHFTAEQRREALLALDCVHDVVVVDGPDAVPLIEDLKPSIYVKGADYQDTNDSALQREVDATKAHGGEVYFTRTDRWSSSRLLNAEAYPHETMSYLDRARKHWPAIKEAFKATENLKVCFVGETIIDEYRYIRALGKSSKEFLIATEETSSECFEGGVVAAHLHAQNTSTDYVTARKWIKKTRFVDADFNRKLFEVYSTSRIVLSEEERAQFHIRLGQAIEACDVIVVMDFGHGLLDDRARDMLLAAKELHHKFLCVNAQSNSANYGFNPVTKYKGADYVCVDEPEARLAVRDQHGATDRVIRDLYDATRAKNLAVTHGRFGSITYDGITQSRIPAFATRGVDTMGAGDAFLAVSGPLAAVGLDLEACAIAGNVAGAIKCGIVGHRRSVGRDELIQSVESLLK